MYAITNKFVRKAVNHLLGKSLLRLNKFLVKVGIGVKCKFSCCYGIVSYRDCDKQLLL